MTQWMKTLAGSLCILTILLHIVPENRFAKYVRFYAGLLFFLLVLSPILSFYGNEEELEKLLQLEFLREDYYDLETAAEGLAELKNEQILEAFQEELKRQIREIAGACGLRTLSVQIRFDEDGYSPEGISLVVEKQADEAMESAIAEARSEIAGLYLLSASAIEITWQE